MENPIIALYYVSGASIILSFILLIYYVRLRIKADTLRDASHTSIASAIWFCVLLISTVLFLLTQYIK